jgi:hypothetical protein
LQRHAKRLTYNTPSTATAGWNRTRPAVAAAAAANNQHRHRQYFACIGHAAKRTLYGRDDLPA